MGTLEPQGFLDDLLRQARSQVEAAETMGQILAAEKERLRRWRWASRLDAVRDRVKSEVAVEQWSEAKARLDYHEKRFVGALAMFGVGVFQANTGRVKEEPFEAGLHQSANYLRTAAPFGTVMVSVGSRGVFGDVSVVSVSQIARDQRRSELDVMASLRAKGDQLMTAYSFFKLVDDSREKLLSGSTGTVPVLPPEERFWNDIAQSAS